MRNNLIQFGTALVLIALLIALLDPFMVLMPPPLAMAALLVAAALVAVFAGFVLRERPRDEREVMHRLAAGQAAYLAGLAVLTLALLSQGFIEHHIDPWIAAALATMIAAKLAARAVIERKG